MTATISGKGWVVIPSDLRKKYRLRPGAKVQVVDYGGVLALLPQLTDPVAQAAGMLNGKKSLTRALLAEHRRERLHDRQVVAGKKQPPERGIARRTRKAV